jgi:hypothetical protein
MRTRWQKSKFKPLFSFFKIGKSPFRYRVIPSFSVYFFFARYQIVFAEIAHINSTKGWWRNVTLKVSKSPRLCCGHTWCCISCLRVQIRFCTTFTHQFYTFGYSPTADWHYKWFTYYAARETKFPKLLHQQLFFKTQFEVSHNLLANKSR